MKKTVLTLSLFISALIGITESTASNVAATTQPSHEASMKEVRHDVTSDNYRDTEIPRAVNQYLGTWRQQQTDLSNPNSSITPDEAEAMVAAAVMQAMINGEPSVLSSPKDELNLMRAANG
jgi:hypothetical protein